MPGAGVGFMNYRGKRIVNGKVRRKLRTGKPAAKLGPKVASSVRQIAKEVIRAQAEHKYVGAIIENNVVHNGAIGSGDVFPVIPQIAQGTASNQRSGDSIRPTGLYVDAALSFNDYGQGFVDVPLRVFCWILQYKGIKSSSLISGVPIQDLLENGAGSTTSFDGTTLASFYPIDKANFDVLGARSFRISDMTQENSKCLTKRVSFKVSLPATLMYDAGASVTPNYPTNAAPFMVVGWCRDDGVPASSTQVYLKVNSYAKLYYTDM